ncbi:MAG: heparinase II/III family protein, partial [Pseudomonadota bacterium]|nr:heparinase II/III family protein [Pseudomonadota bacterium]
MNAAAVSRDVTVRQARALLFSLPLYTLTLTGRAPERLVAVPPDPWPGRVENGHDILCGVYAFAGKSVSMTTPVWSPVGACPTWLAEMHGFDWLRDLRAVAGDNARRRARELIQSWITRHRGWSQMSWRPDIAGARIANLIGLHDFYCASADNDFRRKVFSALLVQTRHLARNVLDGPDGLERILALKGLAYGGLFLPGQRGRAVLAMRLLEPEIAHQILPDGMHAARSPEIHLMVLRHLIDLRNALKVGRMDVPDWLGTTIERMAPALRFFRHGDGALALFNGGHESTRKTIEMVLAQAAARGRAKQVLKDAGFVRITKGKTLILTDVGAPPPEGLDRVAHAGMLAFEMSTGRERLIVNCGSVHAEEKLTTTELRGTSSHSTVTVADLDQAGIAQPGFTRRPERIGWERTDHDGAVLLDMGHDGYRASLGIIHRRRLYLSADGGDLRGEDRLAGMPDAPFVISFYLHPDTRASLIQNGTEVLIRLTG